MLQRPWTSSGREPYRKTYALKPGQTWSHAPVTTEQWEAYVWLGEGHGIPVGCQIARELKQQGATLSVFVELWGGVVLVNDELVCVPLEGDALTIIDALRAANRGSLAGFPDVMAIFPNGTVAFREAKNRRAKDRVGPRQHVMADVIRDVLGTRADLAVIEWDLLPATR